jgi:hypothetical protein
MRYGGGEIQLYLKQISQSCVKITIQVWDGKMLAHDVEAYRCNPPKITSCKSATFFATPSEFPSNVPLHQKINNERKVMVNSSVPTDYLLFIYNFRPPF